jgi:predicted O-methyltransferase YrrM
MIRRRDVRIAIEMGSGVSTVCIAQFLKDMPATREPRILYSFEQDPDYASQTRQLLAELSLSGFASVIDAPLSTKTIEGAEFETYSEAPPIGHGSAQFLLIDGPRGQAGARFAPLLSMRPFMSRDAVFFLDDALRDSEIETWRRWTGLPWVVLDGIVLVGHGLLQGRIADG